MGKSKKPNSNKSTPAFDSLISYMLPFNRKGKGQVNFDISEQEFGVIGYVVVQWSFLEATLYTTTHEMYEVAGKPVPEDAAADDFKTRVRAFYNAVQEFVIDRALKDKRIALYNRIVQTAKKTLGRHTIAHGIWTYDPKSPGELWVLNRRKTMLSS